MGVHDGDTVTLLDAEQQQHKIRLDGIDAPELGQPFGHPAKQNLSDLVAGRQVVAECSKTDRYRRQVCVLMVTGVDAGLEQLRAGLAWYFRRYAKELPVARRLRYAEAEAQAQVELRGLWSETDVVPPWDWRLTSQRSPTK